MTDSSLIDPIQVLAWEDLVVVLEDQIQVVRAFDHSGLKRWEVGRRGEGPLEFLQAFRMFAGPREALWVEDGRLMKLVRIDREGELLGEQSYRHLSGVYGPIRVGSRLLWRSLSVERPYVWTDWEHLAPSGEDPPLVPWDIPTDGKYAPDMRTVAAAFDSAWVVALTLGNAFAVGGPDGIRVHAYRDQRWHAYRPGRWTQQDPLADSAYWSARSVSVVDDEIFFLFGGRPLRQAHEEVPTTRVDVYALDGAYRRSYRLPFAAHSMATMDGRTFYLLTYSEWGMPMLIGVRARG